MFNCDLIKLAVIQYNNLIAMYLDKTQKDFDNGEMSDKNSNFSLAV